MPTEGEANIVCPRATETPTARRAVDGTGNKAFPIDSQEVGKCAVRGLDWGGGTVVMPSGLFDDVFMSGQHACHLKPCCFRFKMIRSDSESVDESAGSAEEHGAVKAESSDEREVAADWRGLKKAKEEPGPVESGQEPWVPIKVSKILNKVFSFKEFMAQRTFNFVHFFCGGREVLREWITRMATLWGIQVRIVAFWA